MKCHSLSLLFLLCAVPLLRAAESDPPLPVRTWATQVQVLGAKYRKGDTAPKTELAAKAFMDAFEKEHKSKRIQFIVKVKEVRWKDGVAEVYTESELGEKPKTTPQTPMYISRVFPFELRMTLEEAAAIKPGAQLRFVGTMTLHRGRWGSVGRTEKAHQLYTVRHEYLSTLFAGTFTSSDAEIRIGDRVYPGRWDQEKK